MPCCRYWCWCQTQPRRGSPHPFFFLGKPSKRAEPASVCQEKDSICHLKIDFLKNWGFWNADGEERMSEVDIRICRVMSYLPSKVKSSFPLFKKRKNTENRLPEGCQKVHCPFRWFMNSSLIFKNNHICVCMNYTCRHMLSSPPRGKAVAYPSLVLPVFPQVPSPVRAHTAVPPQCPRRAFLLSYCKHFLYTSYRQCWVRNKIQTLYYL